MTASATLSSSVLVGLALELREEVHRSPQDAAQHVAATFVRRQHAVGDEERRRARMLGDDADREVDASDSPYDLPVRPSTRSMMGAKTSVS